LPRQGRRQCLGSAPRRRTALGPNGVTGLLLDPDHVRLVGDADDARPVALGDVGDVRDPVDQQRVYAGPDEPRVDLANLAPDRQPGRRPHRDMSAVAGADAVSGRRPRRSYSARTAATRATGRRRPRAGTSPTMIRSSKRVDSRPARKSACATMRASTGIVVRTPTTLYSASARAIRSTAAERSAPPTISFARSVS